jgi:hypothetical protein
MADALLRSSFGETLLAAAIVVACVGLTCTVHAQRTDKQVLVLYSTRPDSQLSIVGEGTLPRILKLGVAQNVIYYEPSGISVGIDPTRRSGSRWLS